MRVVKNAWKIKEHFFSIGENDGKRIKLQFFLWEDKYKWKSIFLSLLKWLFGLLKFSVFVIFIGLISPTVFCGTWLILEAINAHIK
jgi:hypothetical protein